MRIHTTEIDGVLLMEPTPHHDDRGFFTRTFDAVLFDEYQRAAGRAVRAGDFLQDSQSRSRKGVVRGLHGRSGEGESKLIRCARGAVFDVLVDARPDSSSFGRWQSFTLDDSTLAHLFVPAGILHGHQALTEWADLCYRIDRPHDPAEDVAVAHDDPDLAIDWPLAITVISSKDAAAGSWATLAGR
ncbi:dTDP-4-dehydrorhamnose 3,5-epimerase [Mycobacteroides saopaulense]|uniref:dTDP-4-dehydrorhamnose 3,5-epimerase n=1 Tax=Mycobacteroides saopaulense TaxID=1578165 RepID=A0A1X0JER8_9MYCO|nr:dTDP-4-dehydrorhamnose 3,5-epimerase family protein [Mycobacteroides saopaulense]ORB61006.1 dTDP-4-dehydrorhamnose 3,5-epimerase [Mycobacteroides saopaulense]